MKFVSGILLVLCAMGLCSCLQLHGLHINRSYSLEDHKHLEKKLGFSSIRNIGNSYEKALDAAALDSIAKDYWQPMQFWLYRKGKLNLAEVNCYAGGFPNLHWHFRQGHTLMEMSKYPDLRRHGDLLGLPPDKTSADKAYAIVIWTQAMGRQNKRFIREVKRFLVSNPDVTAYYFNADSLLANNGQ